MIYLLTLLLYWLPLSVVALGVHIALDTEPTRDASYSDVAWGIALTLVALPALLLMGLGARIVSRAAALRTLGGSR